MKNRRLIATATLCVSLGAGAAVAGTPLLYAQQTAQPMDENGQVTNPQPHTKQDYEQEKKREKKELKHNQKADEAAKKASEHQNKSAYEQEKSAKEAAKANQAAQQPQ
jgi:excinuclease UvrABC helicase subunit UvrB